MHLSTIWNRAIEALPATVAIAVPWWPEPVAVVTVEEVERAHPIYAELLARWRSRREAGTAVK